MNKIDKLENEIIILKRELKDVKERHSALFDNVKKMGEVLLSIIKENNF